MSFPKVNPAEVEEAHRRLARFVAAEEGTCQACHQLTSSCYCDGPADECAGCRNGWPVCHCDKR